MERGRTARHQPHRIAGRVSVDAKEGMPHHTAALTRCPDPRATEKSSRKPPVQFQKTVRTGNLCPLVDCPPATLGPGATGLRDPCGRDHPRDKGSLTRFAWSGQSHSNSSVVGRQEKDRLPLITQAKIVGAFDASNNLTALEQGIYRGLSQGATRSVATTCFLPAHNTTVLRNAPPYCRPFLALVDWPPPFAGGQDETLFPDRTGLYRCSIRSLQRGAKCCV